MCVYARARVHMCTWVCVVYMHEAIHSTPSAQIRWSWKRAVSDDPFFIIKHMTRSFITKTNLNVFSTLLKCYMLTLPSKRYGKVHTVLQCVRSAIQAVLRLSKQSSVSPQPSLPCAAGYSRADGKKPGALTPWTCPKRRVLPELRVSSTFCCAILS